MTLFNIGPLEFILILVVMFILLGPEGMVKTARQIGVWIRQTIRSPLWGEVLGYSREIRELPNKIVRESGLDEDLKEIQKAASDATREAQSSIEQASLEINKSLKETGSIEVMLDGSGSKVKNIVNPLLGDNSIAGSVGSVSQPASAVPAPGDVPVVEVEKPKPPVILD
jgi:sec-independent protein translocase protein TatB